MSISGGSNVYPAGIEAELMRVPGKLFKRKLREPFWAGTGRNI